MLTEERPGCKDAATPPRRHATRCMEGAHALSPDLTLRAQERHEKAEGEYLRGARFSATKTRAAPQRTAIRICARVAAMLNARACAAGEGVVACPPQKCSSQVGCHANGRHGRNARRAAHME